MKLFLLLVIPEVKKPSVNNKEILDMLEKGEISAEQAVNMMKEN